MACTAVAAAYAVLLGRLSPKGPVGFGIRLPCILLYSFLLSAIVGSGLPHMNHTGWPSGFTIVYMLPCTSCPSVSTVLHSL
jgi:hypothetical protein